MTQGTPSISTLNPNTRTNKHRMETCLYNNVEGANGRGVVKMNKIDRMYSREARMRRRPQAQKIKKANNEQI